MKRANPKSATTAIITKKDKKESLKMGFQIVVKTGDAGEVTLRGCADGTVEFCKWQDVKDPVTKVVTPTLVAYKWYASIVQAFERVARMRVASAAARDLSELVAAVKAIRSDIKREMGAI